MPEIKPITLLLQECALGDKKALDLLVPRLYPELRRLARGYVRNERSNHTLQPTALVHEAYARLIKQEQPDYRSRAHFMGVAANDSLKARLIEMRFFGGMTAEDSASVLEMPVEQVRRHLRVGQGWLKQRLDCSATP